MDEVEIEWLSPVSFHWFISQPMKNILPFQAHLQ